MRKIIIIGLTNVGKSTLFNKLCGRSISTTFHLPDTTLDYISVYFTNLTLIDTAGIHNLENLKELETKLIKNDDTILFVVNKNISDMERLLIDYLRKYKIILLVNKENQEIINYNSLGLEVFFISSATGFNINKLKKRLEITEIIPKNKLTIGVIGKANVGKSTFINSLVGYNRNIVRDEIGTTRDLIEVETDKYIYIDTPGYRNSKEHLDKISKIRRHQVLSSVDGVIVLVDTSQPITNIDKKMLQESEKYGKFVIFCVNRKDIISDNFINNYFPNMFYISSLENDFGGLLEYIDNTVKALDKNIIIPRLNIKDLQYIKAESQVIKYKGKIKKNLLKYINRTIVEYNNLYGVKLFLEEIK